MKTMHYPPGADDLQTRIGYTWQNKDLLVQALTHSTYGNEHKIPFNQRLEFLGDAVIDLLSAEFLMVVYPSEREGVLSQQRSVLVQASALAACARELQLDNLLLVGRGGAYLRQVESVLCDALEAIIGAAYQDCCGDINTMRAIAVAAGILR